MMNRYGLLRFPRPLPNSRIVPGTASTKQNAAKHPDTAHQETLKDGYIVSISAYCAASLGGPLSGERTLAVI